MTSKADLKKRIGQMFIVGFDGFSVPTEFKDFVRDYNLGGTIYFKRNCESPAQIAELSNEIQFQCRDSNAPPLFISIDHEGGKVNRLSKPFTKFSGNDAIGEMGSPKVAFEFGAVLARELRAVGVNINYAPVVDVNSNPKNPVINTRAFSSDPETVGKLGSAVCRGLQKFNVMAVAKHFPGHGDTTEDSHFSLPKVEKTLAQLEECELIPFRRVIRSRVEAIMTAHILMTGLDPDLPATMSRKIMTGLLRETLRFSKLIISDDLEMKAISDHFGRKEAAVQSIAAGCDLLIYRGDLGYPSDAIEAIAEAVHAGKIPLEQIEKSLARIEGAKKQYCEIKHPIDVIGVGKSIGTTEHYRLADLIAKREVPPEYQSQDAEER